MAERKCAKQEPAIFARQTHRSLRRTKTFADSTSRADFDVLAGAACDFFLALGCFHPGGNPQSAVDCLPNSGNRTRRCHSCSVNGGRHSDLERHTMDSGPCGSGWQDDGQGPAKRQLHSRLIAQGGPIRTIDQLVALIKTGLALKKSAFVGNQQFATWDQS